MSNGKLAVSIALAALLGMGGGIALGLSIGPEPVEVQGYQTHGNPQGTRAAGRFAYTQYDDAMEIVKDSQTGKEYLVWYYRDEIEVVPL